MLRTTSPGRCALLEGMFSTSAEHAHDVGARLAAGQRQHGTEHGGGPAHVGLHLLHALRRLDRDAAGVEADALADQRQRLPRPAPPFQRMITTKGGCGAALGHAEQRVHAQAGPVPRGRAPRPRPRSRRVRHTRRRRPWASARSRARRRDRAPGRPQPASDRLAAVAASRSRPTATRSRSGPRSSSSLRVGRRDSS